MHISNTCISVTPYAYHCNCSIDSVSFCLIIIPSDYNYYTLVCMCNLVLKAVYVGFGIIKMVACVLCFLIGIF